MSLAAKLPYDHPYAGGYPGIGSQPLPTDADALDYLARVKAADGAGVEVGVATAVDDFIRGMKADGIWDAIKAACIMCGARTISGALVPLKGTAPTPYNFVAADYDRSGGGLKGDGSTKYLDSNRANNADGQDDDHNAVYVTTANTQSVGAYIGSGTGVAGANNIGSNITGSLLFTRLRTAAQESFAGQQSATGTIGMARSLSSEYDVRFSGSTTLVTQASDGAIADNVFVFARNDSGTAISITDARLAFYSIGSSLDLAALDNRVTTLVAAIAAAI